MRQVSPARTQRANMLGFVSFALLVLSFAAPLRAVAQLTKSFSWAAPVANADGSTPLDLAGYEVGFGTSPGSYTQSVTLGNSLTAQVNFPAPGTYYVAVRGYDNAGNRGAYSNEVTVAVAAQDQDTDGTSDAVDCAPSDNTRWRNGTFFADEDSDGIRSSLIAVTLCYGASAPTGYTLSANGLDNCPTLPNADQSD